MKKILLILCLIPFLGYSQVSYKIKADSTILSNIGSGKNELVIRNATSDVTGGVLTNLGNGVTAFVISGGDSQTLSISGDTLSISNGNSVVLPVFVQVDSAVINSYTVLNSQNAPPGSPVTGDTYLVGTSPSGVWVGHAKDIAEWNGSSWGFIDAVQGDFLYNTTNALTYIFRSGNWVQTTALPALNNGNNILSGLKIGTNNTQPLTFETNNINRGRFDSTGRFYVYNIPTASDTFLATVNSLGVINKIGKNSIVDTFVLSTKGNVTGLLLSKQNNLVSGTNIKTVNSTSLLGSGNITTPDAQTLSTTYSSDSIALSISGGNTIKFAYAVDSVGLNGAGDSIIVYKYGIRKPYKNGSSGGGGGSLSSLTAASASNNINNTNYKQRWLWSTLAGDTALALLSTSTAAASNLQNVLTVANSGANATSSQTTYGAIFSNTKTGTTNTNIAARFVASGASTNNWAIEAESQIKLINSTTSPRYLSFWSGSTENGRIGNFNSIASDNLDIINNCGLAITFKVGSSGTGTEQMRLRGDGQFAIGTTGSGSTNKVEISKGSFSYALTATSGKILSNDGFSVTSGSSTWLASGNDDVLVTNGGTFKYFYTNLGMSVGKGSAPAASAICELTSTTQGFLVSRGTIVNRDAIATPATLLQFGNTTLNTIDTYDGTRWTNGAKFLTNTATLDFGSTAAGAVSDLTITVTGAADGDAVMLGVPNASIVAAGSYSAWVSGANTVTVRYANNALVTAYDPASGTFKVTVNK